MTQNSSSFLDHLDKLQNEGHEVDKLWVSVCEVDCEDLYSVVNGRLFIGDFAGTYSKEVTKHGLTDIVTMTKKKPTSIDGLNYFYFPIDDSPDKDASVYFKQTREAIDERLQNEGKVFVHCNAGVSRSATIVISYLCYKLGEKPEEALKILRQSRPVVFPNSGFWQQLQREYDPDFVVPETAEPEAAVEPAEEEN